MADDAPIKTVRDALAATAPLATMRVEVAGGHGRKPRTATVGVHATEVTVRLTDERTGTQWPVRLWAVWAHETGAGRKDAGLDWVLLTTRPVETAEDACLTVTGYRMRWRVENDQP